MTETVKWCCDGKQASGEDQHNPDCQYHHANYKPQSSVPMNKSETIDTGDSVLHGPTGETWVVAYVQSDRLAWCGWPEGEANLSDCKLVEAASDEDRAKLLKEMAEMPNNDARKRYARWRLGLR